MLDSLDARSTLTFVRGERHTSWLLVVLLLPALWLPAASALSADFNGDGRVDQADLLLFLEAWRERGRAPLPAPTATPTPTATPGEAYFAHLYVEVRDAHDDTPIRDAEVTLVVLGEARVAYTFSDGIAEIARIPPTSGEGTYPIQILSEGYVSYVDAIKVDRESVSIEIRLVSQASLTWTPTPTQTPAPDDTATWTPTQGVGSLTPTSAATVTMTPSATPSWTFTPTFSASASPTPDAIQGEWRGSAKRGQASPALTLTFGPARGVEVLISGRAPMHGWYTIENQATLSAVSAAFYLEGVVSESGDAISGQLVFLDDPAPYSFKVEREASLAQDGNVRLRD